MNNEIYVRRRRKLFVLPGEDTLDPKYPLALLENLKPLGYTLSPAVLERLGTLSVEQIGAVHDELVLTLQALVGAHQKYKPFYPNFPQQVVDMPQAHLYLNAIIHYWTNLRPNFPVAERPPLLDDPELKVIDLGEEAEFNAIFTLLVAGNGSLSVQDKTDVAWFVNHFEGDIFALLPEQVPSRETVAYVGALLLKKSEQSQDFLSKHVKTATDVLRLAVALSDGDVSLALVTRFPTFSRRIRRQLLELLEAAPNLEEDMLRWKGRWLRLGERLHPGEWQTRFPRASAAFETLRKNRPVERFNRSVELSLENKDVAAALEVARTRPGDFARRLDHLLRLDANLASQVVHAFETAALRVSTPVLLQLRGHFRDRVQPHALRTFIPKGNIAKIQALENTLPALSEEICTAIVHSIDTALRQRFQELPPMGKCYLDPALANFPLPSGMRSAAKALRTLPRGSRLPMPEAHTLRFFIWWQNGRSRTDIDLSAALYDAEYVYKDVISYYNLKGYGGHHSGDIVDAPEGAAEFIDLTLDRLREMNIRFIVMSVNSYTTQPFKDLPECFAGWMARQKPKSGEIFEPRTVHDRVDLAGDTQISLPLIFDLEEKTVIWADLALTRHASFNNVQNNLSGVSLMLRAMNSLSKTNLHELFSLHIQARGELVEAPDAAERVFSVQEGITPFDIDRILAEYMA